MCCGDGGGSGIVAWFTSETGRSLVTGLGDGEHCESTGSGVEEIKSGRRGGTDEVGEDGIDLVDVGVVGVDESFVGSKRGKGQQVLRAARDDRNSFFTLPGG